MIRKILLLLVLAAAAATAHAETKYVIDHLIITLRAGQGNQYQILRTLPSGTKLEVLETGEEYSRVRTPDGTEGWALNQYLTATPIAKVRLATAEAKLTKLEAENSRLKQELSTVSAKEAKVSKEHQALSGEQKKLTEELNKLRRVAAKPLQLENENQKLKKQLLDLENQHELLRQENQLLRDSSDREWFLTGAGVIIGGIILGLILPSLRPRKKSGWSSL
jgi:SH3 domain protein